MHPPLYKNKHPSCAEVGAPWLYMRVCACCVLSFGRVGTGDVHLTARWSLVPLCSTPSCSLPGTPVAGH